MDVIFRMLGHIIIDDMTDASDVEAARRDVGRDHYFIFAALKAFQRFDTLALGAVGVQHRHRVFAIL